MANSNSFLSPYEILPIAFKKQIFRGIFLFYHKIVCCVYSLESPHRGDSNEYTPYNYCVENRKDFPKLSLFASWPGAMINLHWLELPMARTLFHGPKGVRAIEVRLYIVFTLNNRMPYLLTVIVLNSEKKSIWLPGGVSKQLAE